MRWWKIALGYRECSLSKPSPLADVSREIIWGSTMSTDNPPWASGPGEILRHGLSLLKKDSDTNRRLAMISIDNAVELMIKTYLGLPKRVTGISISRKDFQEISESFPALLDALEKHGALKVTGIDLGEIEWYHRLRNQLYHQGNGLTVEREKVEVYAQLANTLFFNLFGTKLAATSTELLGDFLDAWNALEIEFSNLAEIVTGKPTRAIDALKTVEAAKIITASEAQEVNELRRLRNDIVHVRPKSRESLTPQVIERLNYYAQKLSTALAPRGPR
ncbi:MAG: hypothetical protein SFV54_28295 [Bryobacteraceae bacterium]|nr:hypothetical protein [Bryobacteraceae bacterium]